MSDEETEDNGEGMLAPELEEACRNLVAQKKSIARAKARVKEAETLIKEAMGVNRFLEAGKYTVTWQTQSRKEYTVPAGTTRRFSIKERTDD